MGELGRFKKLLGGLGKRIYHWRETKESMNFLSFMYETIMQEYAEIYGDYEKSIDHLVELVKPMTEELVAKLLSEIKVMGVSASSFITQNVDDLPYIIETVIYAIFGSWSKIYSKPKLIPAAESASGVDEIIITFDKCPFCCNTMIKPEQLGAHHYGKFTVLTFEQCIQQVQDYAELDNTVVARETKCFLNGDPYGEFYFWIYPNDKLHLMEQNEVLKRIK